MRGPRLWPRPHVPVELVRPYLASLGDHRRARPWVREMRLEAQRTESLWRLSDVLAFDTWDRFFGQSEFGASPANSTAGTPCPCGIAKESGSATLSCGKTRRQPKRRSTPSCAHAAALARRRSGLLNSWSGLRAWGAGPWMIFGPGVPPEIITMGSLGPILGEAEVIANRGSQRAAAEWLEQLVALLPAGGC